MKSSFDFKGNVTVKLFGNDGKLKDIRKVHNTVTNAGLYGVLDQVLASPTLSKIGWMELGTGTGGVTKLNAYISGSRTAFDSKGRTTNVVTVVTTFGAGVGTGTVTEAGCFDIVTQDSGNMWMYSSFTGIVKGADDSLEVTWTLTATETV